MILIMSLKIVLRYIMQNRVVVHVGYPKTATTTLQNHLFLSLQDVVYIGKPATYKNSKMQKFIHTITDCEAFEYEKNYEQFLQDYNEYIISKKPIIVSEETFITGSTLSGRVDRLTILKRLKQLYPDARIIITVREHKNMIKSYYLQKLRFDTSFTVSFDRWFSEQWHQRHRENIFQYFFYDEIISKYEEYFGNDKIKVMYFEDLKTNPKKYYTDIIEFLKCKTNIKFDDLIQTRENSTLSTGEYYAKKVTPYCPDRFKTVLFSLITKVWKESYPVEMLPSHVQIVHEIYDDDRKKMLLRKERT